MTIGQAFVSTLGFNHSTATMDSGPRVAFIGLGAMGFGMAVHLVHSGFNVTGCDIDQRALDRLVNEGGQAVKSSREAVKDATVVIMMVVSAAQIDSILFDANTGAAESLRAGATLVICATVSPSYPVQLQTKLASAGVRVIDCPVSGGAAKAANGSLKLFASGNDGVLEQASTRLVLETMAEKVQVIPSGLGASTKIKLINQQLAGIHIIAAAEVTALAAVLGLNLRQLYRAVVDSDATSWMYENRVPHIMDVNWTPKSALDIFVKDMGIVAAEGSLLACPMPLSCVAQQLYLAVSANGYGREDDSGVVRLYLGQRTLTPSTEVSETNDAAKTATVLLALHAMHLVAAAEAFTLCEKLDLDDSLVQNSISGAGGSSRAFESYAACRVGNRTGDYDFGTVRRELVSEHSKA
jgi:3-hydroxyisobutyrate dehydrogenase